MEQIILYVWLFVDIVRYGVDTLLQWLTAHGFPSGVVVIGIIGAIAFYFIDECIIEIGQRLQVIESKLGIERTPAVERKLSWWVLFAWFVVAVYLLGKSFPAEGFASATGIGLSGVMLLAFAVSFLRRINEAVRNYMRKKRANQQWLDEIFRKQNTD